MASSWSDDVWRKVTVLIIEMSVLQSKGDRQLAKWNQLQERLLREYGNTGIQIQSDIDIEQKVTDAMKRAYSKFFVGVTPLDEMDFREICGAKLLISQGGKKLDKCGRDRFGNIQCLVDEQFKAVKSPQSSSSCSIDVDYSYHDKNHALNCQSPSPSNEVKFIMRSGTSRAGNSATKRKAEIIDETVEIREDQEDEWQEDDYPPVQRPTKVMKSSTDKLLMRECLCAQIREAEGMYNQAIHFAQSIKERLTSLKKILHDGCD